MQRDEDETVDVPLPWFLAETIEGGVYGTAERFREVRWNRDHFTGEITTETEQYWEANAIQQGAGAIEQMRWWEYDYNPLTGDVASEITRERDGAFWFFFLIERHMFEIPLNEDTDIELRFQGEINLNDYWTHLDMGSSAIGPDTELVISGIPMEDYTYERAEIPNDILPAIVGPEAIEMPEYGTIPLSQFTLTPEPAGNGSRTDPAIQPWTTRLTAYESAVGDLIRGDQFPFWLALRVWLRPQAVPLGTITDETAVYIAGSGINVTLFSPGTADGVPIDQENALPILNFEVSTPIGEEVIHVRHVAKRTREQHRRPSNILRMRG